MLIKRATSVPTMYKNSIVRKSYFELNVYISLSVGRGDSALVVCFAGPVNLLVVGSSDGSLVSSLLLY